jgi:glycosyltransferase 2 family protein
MDRRGTGVAGVGAAAMSDESRQRRRDLLRWVLGLGIAVAVFWWLRRDFDWPAVVDALQRADYRWVLLGAAAIVATAWTRTRRWQALLHPSAVRFLPALHALLVGQVANLILPLRGGDLTRALLIGPEEETSAALALGTVALEKVWDLVLLLLSGLLLLLVMPLPGWFARSTWGTGLTLLVGIPVLWAALHWRETLFRWMGRLLAALPGGWDRAVLPRLRRLADGLASIRQTETSLRAFLWTALTWGLGALANWAVLAAFGLPSEAAALLLLVALMVGNSVVPTPARLGVFEGITVGILALFDVPGDVALAVGLVLHLVVMGPPLLMAALSALGAPLLSKELHHVT